MHPEDWPRVKDVFDGARPLAADARASYLDAACGGNAVLRRQVEALLESYSCAGSFLETPAQLTADMTETPTLEGQRIGPYEVSSQIGAGGMGDVYKARDTRLDRTVALKVLPMRLASDPVARDRFEREARTVAALNHPHICTLHDIGRHNGIDYLVMEYLEGETLAARIERGPMPFDRALELAIHIASALDKVHRAGIVHRDLKPGNIMLTKGGAKLLDFGLSNATAALIPEAQRHDALDITAAGTILGTLQYMAPEQLEGRKADARSDIFAFGAVLYEMLAGGKAFEGLTHANVVSAIRAQEPAAVPALPPMVDRLIRTCLAKDPDDRWQTSRDLLRELKWAADAGVHASGVVRPASIRYSRRIAWAIGGTALVLSAFAASAWLPFDRAARDVVPARFEVPTPPTSDPMSFAISPDGRQLIFVATDEGTSKLWLRPLDQVDAQPLPGTDGATYPFWEPAGEAIAFFAGGKLKRLDLGAGPPRILADAPNGRGGSWSRDGVIVFAPSTAGPLMRILAAGGTAEPATRLEAGQNSHRWPSFLPDGRQFLFLSTHGQSDTPGVRLGTLGSASQIRVLEEDSAAVFTSPNVVLFVRQGTLVAMELDLTSGQAHGDAIQIAQPVGFDTNLSRGAFSVSENGVLAHRPVIAERRQLVWVDRTGLVRGSVGRTDENAIAAPELTGDGNRVAVVRTVDGNADIWVMNVEGGMSSRMTFNVKPDVFPVWFPDAARLAYTSLQNDTYNLFERRVNGSGDERPLGPKSGLKVATDVSPDGEHLLYNVQVPQTGVDIWVLPVKGNDGPSPFARTAFDEMSGQFSPDGRWIAYQSNASGRMEIYVAAFPGAGNQLISAAGGTQPRWSTDGTELFYVGADNRMMSVPVRQTTAGGSLDTGRAVALFPTNLATGANVPPAIASRPQYDVSNDGRFLMNVSAEGANAAPITVALDWRATLK